MVEFDNKRKNLIRTRIWYKRYKELSNMLNTTVPNPIDRIAILKKVHSMIYYTSLSTANGAYEAIQLLIEENNWQQGAPKARFRGGQ